MSYTFRIIKGSHATQVYLKLKDTDDEIFTFQLDYGCSDDTYIDIRYDGKWTNINSFAGLSDDVKPLFILSANFLIDKLSGDYPVSDKAIVYLQDFMKN